MEGNRQRRRYACVFAGLICALGITAVLSGEAAGAEVYAKCRKNKIPATGIAVPEQIRMG